MSDQTNPIDPQNIDPKTMEETLENIANSEEPNVSTPTPDDEVTRLRDALARSQADY